MPELNQNVWIVPTIVCLSITTRAVENQLSVTSNSGYEGPNFARLLVPLTQAYISAQFSAHLQKSSQSYFVNCKAYVALIHLDMHSA